MAAKEYTDWAGHRFGRLVAVAYAGSHIQKNGRHRPLWLCKCDCGNVATVQLRRLVDGSTKSCGCFRRDSAVPPTNRGEKPNLIHGMYGTRVYRIWRKMIERCTREKNDNYARYGGSGIKVCDAWRHDFSAFYAHMGNPPTDKHSIDRIDNSRGYEPGNCRWATPKEQAANKRKRGTGC